MSKHIHADAMLAYALDAVESETPWENWLVESVDFVTQETFLSPCTSQITWDKEKVYKRKQTYIDINGFQVPEPVRKPLAVGTYYYVVRELCDSSPLINWDSDEIDLKWLHLGLIHLTQEAAELHRKALLSFTEKKE